LELLTSGKADVVFFNINAISILKERISFDDGSFVDRVIWQLPPPLADSVHDFKYRLALVSDDICVMRYDNEAGKDDHKHLGNRETTYVFGGLDKLQADFWVDVARWRQK
jgi:Family of unknown function (DUF6516)